MRQIELCLVAAIRKNDKFKMGNTEYRPFGADHTGAVLLHGNVIARILPGDEVSGFGVIPVEATFCTWPTPTTRSRLRALGVDASIKNGVACINGVAL